MDDITVNNGWFLKQLFEANRKKKKPQEWLYVNIWPLKAT